MQKNKIEKTARPGFLKFADFLKEHTSVKQYAPPSVIV
jgi:hypothetical protein